MDLPGPSSSTNNVVSPVTMYYDQPTPPLLQQPTPPLNLPLMYQNFLQMPSVKPQYLIRSDISAFKEVNDLRNTVSLILPTIAYYPQLAHGLNAAAALTPQTFAANFSQNLLRKRSAAPTPTAQPECPASMRTAMNGTAASVPNSFLLSNWLSVPMRAPSPTLPTGNIATMSIGETQVPHGDEQTVKWSSPSSVDSNGQKTDSSTVSATDSHNIDIVGDGSESSTSSTSAQDQIQSLYNSMQSAQKAQAHAQLASVLKADSSVFFPTVSQTEMSSVRIAQMPSSSTIKQNNIGPERKPRKPVNDDIVKIVRQQDLSAEAIATIEIPVPKALESDATFRPVPEQQIIQQIIQGKKYEEMEVGECMIQLCKKLAEKRVFGPRLMSQTTVAGLNHSNYSNLPIKGICYIQHVCWNVLRDKFDHDEDFWDKFREAMRKLAARCRRVRHAKKTKHNREESLAQQELSKRFASLEDPMRSSLQSLGLASLCTKPTEGIEGIQAINETATNQISYGQLSMVFQRLRETGIPMGDQEQAVIQTLMQFRNCQDFASKSEPLSPV